MNPEIKNIIRKTYNCRKKWLAKKCAFKNAFRKSGGTVFIGDSITEFMPVRSFFGKSAYNFGIIGETSDYTLKRFESNALKIKPKAIFLLIGTNDSGTDAEGQTAKNIKSMILLAKKKCPESKLFIATLLPINEKILLATFKREQAFVDKTNRELREMLLEFPDVMVLEIGATMADPDGAMSEDYTKDGLHPTHAGYLKMKEIYDATIKTIPEEPDFKKFGIK